MSTTASGPGRGGGPVQGPCVVVGDNGTRHSDAPVRYAAFEASARGVPLLVLRLASMSADADRSVAAQLREERAAVREAHEALDARLSDVRAGHPRLPLAQGLVVDGTERLADVLKDCLLLVLGYRSRRGPTVFRFGSPSQQLLHTSTCPVVVVPEDAASAAQAEDSPVVAGIDGGPLSQSVLRAAAEEASLRDCALTVVHTYRTPRGGVPETARAAAERLCSDQLRLAGLAVGDTAPGIVTWTAVDENPADALTARSAGARLLVMGTRGSLALGNLTQGSMSRAVLDAASCPVMFVRRPAGGQSTSEHAGATASR